MQGFFGNFTTYYSYFMIQIDNNEQVLNFAFLPPVAKIAKNSIYLQIIVPLSVIIAVNVYTLVSLVWCRGDRSGTHRLECWCQWHWYQTLPLHDSWRTCHPHSWGTLRNVQWGNKVWKKIECSRINISVIKVKHILIIII